jgi:riboflavin synthase
MFTGIITAVGRVEAVAREGPARRLTLDTGFDDLDLGESVAVNGVCLTVASRHAPGVADFFVSPETLKRSNLQAVAAGGLVNLERSVTLATRLSGHLVQGHVDGQGRLTGVRKEGDSWRISVVLPVGLRPFCVEKGSIALDGVSLTLNRVDDPDTDGGFAVSITLIPHTWTHTLFQHRAPGAAINVEVDVLAKYVEQLCHAYPKR